MYYYLFNSILHCSILVWWYYFNNWWDIITSSL